MAADIRLNIKQRKAITALLSTATIADAAGNVGVTERTLYRWMGDPAFRLALSEAETDAISASVRRLVALQEKALDAVEEVLDSLLAKPSTKLRAAQIVLDTSIRLRELHVIEQRLNALEKQLDEH